MTSPATTGPEQPYLNSRTVRDIAEHDPAQIDDAWCRKVFRQLLQSLELQYAMRMPHRAITPDTVVFHDNGEPLLLPSVISDPEPAVADDLTALGALVHFAITRELAPTGPLRGRSLEGYSHALLSAVDFCMSPDPDLRPQSIDELRDLLGIAPPCVPMAAQDAALPEPALPEPDLSGFLEPEADAVEAPPASSAQPGSPGLPQVAAAAATAQSPAIVPPAEPLQSAQSVDVAQPLQSAQPVDVSKSLQSAQPVDVSQPLQSAQPVGVSQPLQSAQPVDVSKPLQSAQPVDVSKPLQSPEPEHLPPPVHSPAAQPLSQQPQQPPQPPQLARPAKPAQPSQPAQPPHAAQPAPPPLREADTPPRRRTPASNHRRRWIVAGAAAAVLLAIALAGIAELRGPASFDRIALGLPQTGDANQPAAAAQATDPAAQSAGLPAQAGGVMAASSGAQATDGASGALATGATSGTAAAGELPGTAAPGATADGAAPADPAEAGIAADGSAPYKLQIQPWGVVHVDGVERGVSPPLKRLLLAPGRHTIRVANPNFQDRVLEIDTAGGERRIAIDFSSEAR